MCQLDRKLERVSESILDPKTERSLPRMLTLRAVFFFYFPKASLPGGAYKLRQGSRLRLSGTGKINIYKMRNNALKNS